MEQTQVENFEQAPNSGQLSEPTETPESSLTEKQPDIIERVNQLKPPATETLEKLSDIPKFNINEREGASKTADIKQKRIPIAQPKPKITTGDMLDIIREAKPIIVVIVEMIIALPVDLSIFSILSILFSMDFSSANLFIIWIE